MSTKYDILLPPEWFQRKAADGHTAYNHDGESAQKAGFRLLAIMTVSRKVAIGVLR